MTAPVVFNIEHALAMLSIILGSDEPAVVTYNGQRFQANIVSDPTAKVVS